MHLFNNILNECPFLRQGRNSFKLLENQHNDTRNKARSSDSFKRNICLLWSKLFVLTSSPIEITNAINFYLTPLKLFKVPTENLALILSVSIQFVPTLLIEAQNISAKFSVGTLNNLSGVR